jgi:hypothetical protein
MQAVRPQFDQPNWNYRPIAVIQTGGMGGSNAAGAAVREILAYFNL